MIIIIGHLLETDMPDGDQNTWSETDMPDMLIQRSNGDQHAWGDPSDTHSSVSRYKMPHYENKIYNTS